MSTVNQKQISRSGWSFVSWENGVLTLSAPRIGALDDKVLPISPEDADDFVGKEWYCVRMQITEHSLTMTAELTYEQ